MNRSSLSRVVLPVLVLSGTAVARAEVTDCTPVTALPATISVGVHCLRGNLTYLGSGPAITIAGYTVVLDLNGHALNGTPSGTAILVDGSSDATIRNGTVIGFGRAVSITSASLANRVENLTIDVEGTLPAIESTSQWDFIVGNRILRGNPAIRTTGFDTRIVGNDVTLATVGIDVAGGSAFVEDNRVTRGTTGIRTGTARVLAYRNRIQNFTTCLQMGSTATEYRENLTTGCLTAYVGGLSQGDNN